jgi:hypothetical protein
MALDLLLMTMILYLYTLEDDDDDDEKPWVTIPHYTMKMRDMLIVH